MGNRGRRSKEIMAGCKAVSELSSPNIQTRDTCVPAVVCDVT